MKYLAVMVILLLGCSHKPVENNSVVLQHCRITEVDADGKYLGCECIKFYMTIDAKTGRRVAICGGK